MSKRFVSACHWNGAGRTQLDATFDEVGGIIGRVKSGGAGPQFAWASRTTVFSSQIGKLTDVDDPLMIEIVHFYSDLGTLERAFESSNELSAEFTHARVSSGDKDTLRPEGHNATKGRVGRMRMR